MGSFSSFDDEDTVFSCSDSDEDVKEEYDEYDMKRAIVNVVSNYEKDKAISSFENFGPKNRRTVEPLLQCMINNGDDKYTLLRTIDRLLSADKGTALHYAAEQASYVLIAALLDHGLDPNIRRPWSDDMNRALPLNLVLDLMAREISKDYCGKLSLFKLVCELCLSRWRPCLECVRLLAPKTRELNDEIIEYTKEGRVIQLCALMLLGYDSRVSTLLDFIELDDSTKEEQVSQLIQAFARIGDKLQAYVTLKSSPFGHCVGGLVSEIGSMFIEAGLPVSNADNLVYQGRDDLEVIVNPVGRIDSFSKVYCREEYLSSPMVHDVALGSRALHTSSILKAHRGVKHSSPLKGFVQPKPQFWWNPSLMMMAVRRVARLV